MHLAFNSFGDGYQRFDETVTMLCTGQLLFCPENGHRRIFRNIYMSKVSQSF
jgi:hypothetical protein